MYLLDTDALSRYFRFPDSYPYLRQRIERVSPASLWVSIVTVEEMMQGRLAELRLAQKRKQATVEYRNLARLLSFLNAWQILEFDDSAQSIFEKFPASIHRIGGGDCRIAASALSRRLTIITSNLSDYSRIPGVIAEDWTLPPQANE